MAGDTIEIADVALDTSMAIWIVKITLEISDPVFKQAKALAAKDEAKPFRLRDGSFRHGQGLQRGLNWTDLTALAYQEEGGLLLP